MLGGSSNRGSLLLAVTAAMTFSVACAPLKRTTTGQWLADRNLADKVRVLVIPIKSEGEAKGAAFTTEIRDSLIRHRVDFLMVEPGSLQEIAAIGRRDGYGYVLRGAITAWEDNATEWSANPDVAALTLELYENDPVRLVATGTHRVVGSQVAFASKSTDRFIPEVVDHALARIFGWPPAVFFGR